MRVYGDGTGLATIIYGLVTDPSDVGGEELRVSWKGEQLEKFF